MGFYGTFGHFMLTQAHRMAPAPVLAPFVYSQIIWMTLIGFVVFGDVPDAMTITGASIVVASGLYVFYRERQVRKIHREICECKSASSAQGSWAMAWWSIC
jgi:drug/metabolite transporter (DMT)-like permease